MSDEAGLRSPQVRVWRQWAHRRIGWPGWLGLFFVAVAGAVFGSSWSSHRTFLQARALQHPLGVDPRTESREGHELVAIKAPAPSRELPGLAQMPVLLNLMKQAVVANGLDWRSADYRVTSATESRPASFDVRCSLRGSYPKVRAALVQMSETVPAFSLRELSVSRQSSGSVDVDAKAVLSIFLRDDSVCPGATP